MQIAFESAVLSDSGSLVLSTNSPRVRINDLRHSPGPHDHSLGGTEEVAGTYWRHAGHLFSFARFGDPCLAPCESTDHMPDFRCCESLRIFATRTPSWAKARTAQDSGCRANTG